MAEKPTYEELEQRIRKLKKENSEFKRLGNALKKQIAALTRPLKNDGNVAFEDLFNIDDIQHLQDEFAKAAGVASIITHTNGKPITAPSNFCRLCKDIIRKTDKGRANCYKSDAMIGRLLSGGPIIRPCMSGGLWDAGAGITAGGRHIANWLIGQVRDELQTEDKMVAYAREIGASEKAVVEAFREVPAMSREQFEQIAKVLFILANQLSTTAYQNVQQARFISERKHAEQLVKESEERFRYLSDASMEAIFFTKKGFCLEANQVAAEIFGYDDRSEFIGMFVTDLVAPESRSIVKSNVLNDTFEPYEAIGMRKNGTRFPISIRAKAMPYKYEGIVRVASISDITNTKQAEKALRESEARFKALHNASFGGISIHDNGIIIDCNRGLSDMTGYSAAELIGMDGLLLIAEESRNTVMNNIVSGYEKPYEATGLRKNGEEFPVRIEGRNMPYKGKNVRAVEFRDITERKQAEAERKKLLAQLNQARKMESIGTLAGGIAHDFNNILYPIVGYTEMLLEDIPEDSPLRSDINEIYAGAMRASDLVKQILTFSRRNNVEVKLIKIQPVIKEALTLIRSTIPTSIEIKQDISNNCGVIKADPTQIHQVVMNLATNAYHAMIGNNGKLKVSLKEIELGEQDVIQSKMEPGVYACLIVADTGMGMDRDLTEKIFDPFFSTKENGKGTGMGLSVVHGIVHGAGGIVRVYSEPGKGTEFHVYLPVVKSVSEQQESQTKKTIPQGTERILLVDDEGAIVSMGKKLLERLGYQVVSSMNSVEAMVTFRTNPDKFDLVITDMAMPNMSGDKLAAKIKKIRQDIPVILVTGFSDKINIRTGSDLQIDAFLMKPVDKANLAKTVRKLLDDAILTHTI